MMQTSVVANPTGYEVTNQALLTGAGPVQLQLGQVPANSHGSMLVKAYATATSGSDVSYSEVEYRVPVTRVGTDTPAMDTSFFSSGPTLGAPGITYKEVGAGFPDFVTTWSFVADADGVPWLTVTPTDPLTGSWSIVIDYSYNYIGQTA
jgi:hypothetical protein